MKKLLSIFLLIFTFTTIKAQFPNTIGRLNPKTLDSVPSAIRVALGFINGVYTDTTAANVNPYFKYYNGAQIMTTTGGLKTWGRYNNTWVLQSGGGGSGNIDSAWNLRGNVALSLGYVPLLGTKDSVELNLGTKNLKRLSIPANGIPNVTGGQYQLLVVDSFTKALGLSSSIVDIVSYIRNAQTGDTIFVMLSADSFLLKSIVVNAPLTSAPTDSTVVLGITQSGTASNGYLSSTDWNIFNGKQAAITLTTTGSSGAATFIGNTLNIPQYSGGTSPDGNYGNVQLNRNGAFKAAGSDSLNFGSSTLSVKGHASLTGNLYLPNSTSSVGSIYLNNLRWLGNGGDASGHTNIFGGQHTGSDTALDNNIGFGTNVLQKTNGRKAIAIGENAAQNVTGYDGGDGSSQFIAIGPGAMSLATGSHMDIMIGPDAGLHLTDTSIHNMGIGKSVWAQLRAGVGNAAFGYSVGANGTGFRGSWNTILGDDAFSSPTSGDNNTSAGAFALAGSTTGGNNSAFAYHALDGLTTGTNNTALGLYAGHNVTTGSFNTHIGSLAGGLDINASNEFVVNSDAAGALMHLIHGNSATHKIGFNITQAQSIAQPDYSLLMHGTSHFDSTVKIDDSLIIDIPSKGANKVLVSDANGAATWTNPAAIGSLTVGSTPIASGTTTKVLFDNGGILGEYTITGSGSVAMSASPTFTGDATVYNLVSSSYGSSFLKSSVGSTYPWVFDLSASFLDNQRGLVIRGSQATTKGNSLEIVDAFFTGLSAFDGAGKLGILNVAPGEALDVTGNVKFSGALMPNNTAGTSGYLLQSAGAGSPPTWVAQSTLAIPLSSITAATTFASPNHGANPITWQWNSLADGYGINFSSNSTTAASNGQTVMKAFMQGANSNSTQTTRAGWFENQHTGTASTNIAGYFSSINGTNNYAIIVPPSGGNTGLQTSSPTAYLHIGAGTATAGTAPLKLTTGTLLTTAEVGAREYNNAFYDTKSSGLRYGLGGVIYDAYADVSNSGTSETDLDTYTTPASTLAADGEKLYFNYTVNLTDITATAAIKMYFGGTAIASTGALTVSATGALIVSGWLIRTSSTTVRASVNISSPTASTAVYTAETDVTGLTLSGTNILKITGTAGGAGGGTGDIVFKLGSIEWKAKANN